MLIIFGGLPGTGKTTISKIIAKRLNAAYLRVDTIEQTLINLDGYPDSLVVGSEGYLISYAVARENLALGLNVVADSVNPIAITRHDWQEVAKQTESDFIEIELICSDEKVHQSRVEERIADIEGHNLPTWQDVLNRDYDSWESKHIVIDTSKYSIDESVVIIMNFIALKGI
ncbi:AAA family ATPase [Legionella anisa]|uniref:Adenylyl-sulfate kinase n=1 Tax=Legionella anisa TaxID=28082 RepID=A0AAX0WW07_9GAMM|nr:AAA family ATPase [Legionella anisa]AWN73481.1 adenylyl-sulfate kinase [Legionella anisa]KTC70784.1 cytidylate kinase [Legionella anisa]MBN5937551.1 AAA family ATPase [Legionella anisa]MCW8426354.1 AAA family ATPase [Legionella anisa]MCW8448014.1 AAA family ATPase [Legionella anisa]